MIKDSPTDVVYPPKPMFMFGIPYVLIHMNELAPAHSPVRTSHILYIQAPHFIRAYELFRQYRKKQNQIARLPGGDMKLVSQACKTPDNKRWKKESYREHINDLYKVNP